MIAFPALFPLPDHPEITGSVIRARDDQGRHLLHLRDDRPDIAAPGQWSLFGGAIEPGEDPLTAALREFHEEAGIALGPADLRPLCRVPMIGRVGLLYVFDCLPPIRREAIRLAEGAGFAFLTADQIARFVTADRIRAVMDLPLTIA